MIHGFNDPTGWDGMGAAHWFSLWGDLYMVAIILGIGFAALTILSESRREADSD